MIPEPARDVVAGIVLAAGEASRMGQPKQLLDLGGSPALQHVINTAEDSALDELVVVLGRFADEIESRIQRRRTRLALNPDYRRGNVSSLVCGAAAVPEADAYVLLMGDQPELAGSAIDQITDLWHRHRPWGAVTRYRDRIGHPFLLSPACMDTAGRTGGSKLLWRLLAEDDTGRVAQVEFPANAPADINTPDDYRDLQVRWRQLPR